jgi:polyisoprenoid-binding protein YceI
MSRRLALVAPLAASAALLAAPLGATTYTLEPDYTQGVFRWDHLGFSSPAAQFAQATGTLEFDASDPGKSSVKVTIPLATLNTGVPGLDEHLRSSDFFDLARFPTATFRSTRVEKGGMANELKVTGELSLHGVTRPVTLDVHIVKIGTNPRTSLATVGFAATTTLKRSDFGLGAYVPQVSDAVRLELITQAVDAKAYAEYLKAEAAEEAAETAKKAAGKQDAAKTDEVKR